MDAKTRTGFSAVAFVAAASVSLGALTPAVAFAGSATNYHVDCSATAAGTGTAEAPLNSVAAVNALTLQPGDKLAFRRGVTCTGAVDVRAQGTAAAPILITDYGTGPGRAVVNAGGQPKAFQLTNSKHVTIENLELQAPGDNRSMRRGLSIVGTDAGELPGITARNLYITNVGGYMPSATNDAPHAFVGKGPNAAGGIIVETLGSTTPTFFTDLVLAGNRIHNVQRQGIYFWSNWCRRPELRRWGNLCHAAFTPNRNVLVTGNHLTEIGGDGIVLHNIVGGVAEHNRLDGFNKGVRAYNAGIWMANAENIVLQYNHVSGGVGNTLDSNAFDVDHASNNVVVRYNLSHDNEGGFLLVCPDPRQNGYGGLNNFAVHDNVSINDQARTFMHGCGGSVEGGIIANNTFYYGRNIPATTVWSDANGVRPNVTIKNNIFFAEQGANVTFNKPGDGLVIDNNHFTNITAPNGATNNVNGTVAFSGNAGSLDPYAYQLATAPTGKSLAWDYMAWAGKLRDYAGRPYIPAGAELGAFQLPAASALIPAVDPGNAPTCNVTLTPKGEPLNLTTGDTINAVFDAATTCHRQVDAAVGVVGAIGVSQGEAAAQIPAGGTVEVTVPLTVDALVHDGTYALKAVVIAGQTPAAVADVNLTVARNNPAGGWEQPFTDVAADAIPENWTRTGAPAPGVVDGENKFLKLARPANANPTLTSVVLPLQATPKIVSFTIVAKQRTASFGIHLLKENNEQAVFLSLNGSGNLSYTNNGNWVNSNEPYAADQPTRISIVMPGDGTYKWYVNGVEKFSQVMKDRAAAKLRLQIPTNVTAASEFLIDDLSVDKPSAWALPYDITPQPLADEVAQFAVTHLAPHKAETGHSAVVVATGGMPGEDLDVTLTNGETVLRAKGRVDADGNVRVPVLIPASSPSGAYIAKVKPGTGAEQTLPKPVMVETVEVPPTAVTPQAPRFEDPSDLTAEGDKIVIPTVPGVIYKIGDQVVSGEVTDITRGAPTVVKAEAAEGYVLAVGATKEWSHLYQTLPVAVTPTAPTFVDPDGTATGDKIVIPTVTGVVYKIDGKVVAGEVTAVKRGVATVVTAEAADGYVLATGAVNSWQHTFAALPTPQPTLEPTQQPTEPKATRLAGSDRIDTALEIWKASPSESRTVVIATSGSYADSLAAVPLAAELDAPMLLTAPLRLDSKVVDAIREGGVKKAYLVGGTRSVGKKIDRQLKDLGVEIVRVAGKNRFATAELVADETDKVRKAKGENTASVFLVDGTNFSDALSAAPIAAQRNGVILLTNGSKAPMETLKYLNRAGNAPVVAVGGKAKTAAEAVVGHGRELVSVAGADRYDTSAKVVNKYASEATVVGVASGEGFADALTGATMLARNNGALLLSTSKAIPASVLNQLKGMDKVANVYVFGGQVVLSDAVLNGALHAVK
ncbi:MAG: cell wall-binding repeat-containing protein [Buchananella hordeovulneris]|nr:cell wall-binding repeat-containing protein [Buchananella hordeovulneris]